MTPRKSPAALRLIGPLHPNVIAAKLRHLYGADVVYEKWTRPSEADLRDRRRYVVLSNPRKHIVPQVAHRLLRFKGLLA